MKKRVTKKQLAITEVTEKQLAITEETNLAKAQEEIEKLKSLLKTYQKDTKKEPEAYLMTTDMDIVENLQLDILDKRLNMRKIKKYPIAPKHVTGSSLYEGKRYFYPIEQKGEIEKVLSKEDMAKFEIVKTVNKSEHFKLSENLDRKMEKSEQDASSIRAVKQNG